MKVLDSPDSKHCQEGEHDRIIKAVDTGAAAASDDDNGEGLIGGGAVDKGAIGEEADDGDQEDVANAAVAPADANAAAEVPVPIVTQEECYDSLTVVTNFAKTKPSPDMLF